MLRPGEQSSFVVPLLAALGLLVAVTLGSWWTAVAVMDGLTIGVFIRFALSVAGGFYYLTMYRVSTGKTLAFR